MLVVVGNVRHAILRRKQDAAGKHIALGVLFVDITEYFGMASSDLEALPKYKKFVRERDAAGLCLQCDKPADKSRGLCTHHHHRFRMDRLETPRTKRKAFEDRMILTGKILPSRQGQRLKKGTAA